MQTKSSRRTEDFFGSSGFSNRIKIIVFTLGKLGGDGIMIDLARLNR